jgi:hypothetical protein
MPRFWGCLSAVEAARAIAVAANGSAPLWGRQNAAVARPNKWQRARIDQIVPKRPAVGRP